MKSQNCFELKSKKQFRSNKPNVSSHFLHFQTKMKKKKKWFSFIIFWKWKTHKLYFLTTSCFYQSLT